jgi:isoquinoline 1-oxidoreductase beta subunit
VRRPGELIAMVRRPRVFGAKVASFDDSYAKMVPGVVGVVKIPSGVAVLATDTWSAMRGRRALAIEWNDGDNAGYDSTTYREKLLASVRAEGTTARQVGDALGVLAKAKRVVEAEYVVPHLAHLTMEPPAAIARIENGACEIWAPTQHPQAARTEAARILGIGEDKVTVNVTLLGGGFGRKSKADFVGEAAYLAAQAKVPVRVQWTREDDVRHCYYNAVNAQRLRAALDDSGKVQAWHHRTAFTPIASTFKAGVDRPGLDDLQQGVLDLALDVPNVRAETCTAPVHARIGWFRSVYNIFHAFAIGSFIDEIAHARGEDPRKVLLEVIGPARKLGLADLGIGQLRNYGEKLEKHPVDAGRLRNVVERVTAAAKWSGRKQGNRGFGLAAHRSFVSYTAVVVAVVEDPRAGVRVDEAWISMDPGLVVNKERVHAQMQGSVIMGISNAMYGGITMKKGAVEQSNFNDARIVRLNEAPRRIHVDLVASTAPPGGVGEPGVPPVGAALANAVFALTGKRVREMPIAAALRK